MMKRAAAMLLCLAMMFALLPAGMTAFAVSSTASAAASGISEDGLAWVLDDEGTITISGTGAMKEYYYDDAPWKPYIGQIKKVVIADGVTSLGFKAFDGCEGLLEFTLAPSVSAIGQYAFRGCTGLTEVILPDTVTSIDHFAFAGCTSLKKVRIGGSTVLGQSLFRDCTALTDATIAEGVESIGSYMFFGCTALENIVIPSTVTRMGAGSFQRCSSLDGVIIPSGVTYIGSNAFCDCSSLTAVVIPHGVPEIRIDTFKGCLSLRSVTIPKSVTTIGHEVFLGCPELKDIYYAGSRDEWYNIEMEDGDWLEDATIHFNTTTSTNPSGSGTTVSTTSSSTSTTTSTETTTTSSTTSPTTTTTTEWNGMRRYFPLRLEGGSRTETAIAISREVFGTAENAVLACGDDFADALAGVPLAYALDAPILLVRNNEIDEATAVEMHRLGVRNVYILGGPVAISEDVADGLEQSGYNVRRVAGTSRFETAVAIASELQRITGAPDEVFFAYSHNYPDALAVSSVAAILGQPIFYISKDGTVDYATASYISNSQISSAVILGGTTAVGADAENNIRRLGVGEVGRIDGASRYDTCMNINKKYADIMSDDTVCIATGKNYPDALAGGVFAAIQKAPILLVADELNAAQLEYLDERNVPNTFAYIFGGKLAVPEKVEVQITGLAGEK